MHHPALLDLSREWEELVREAYSRGHDIQLHVHPQWDQARYEDGKWCLDKRWSILGYPPEDVGRMLAECKQYLEDLIHPINPTYRLVAFRSGSWAVAPSHYLLSILSELGIVFDMSIVSGLYYNFEMVKLDYRNLDEPFLPYYPQMDDARHLASTIQPIVCIPTHSFVFKWSLISKLMYIRSIRKIFPSRWCANFLSASGTPIDNSGTSNDYSKQVWAKNNQDSIIRRLLLSKKEHIVSDLAQLSYERMKVMLEDIRRKVLSSGYPVVPVIIENHTKAIGDFGPIEKFCATITKADDIEVITSSELAKNIKLGFYPIRRANVG
jgi:hypothetical protein